MKLTVAKVVFGVVFLAIVVGAVWAFMVGLYGVTVVAAVLAVLFGVFVVTDIRKALEKRDV